MNGGKDFSETVTEERHRIPRNVAMLTQQLVNQGFKDVRGKYTVTFTGKAPDGSGTVSESIVGEIKDLQPGNGPKRIGGNGQTTLKQAISKAARDAKTTRPSSPVTTTPAIDATTIPKPTSAKTALAKPSVFGNK